jgi:hypothetical protein
VSAVFGVVSVVSVWLVPAVGVVSVTFESVVVVSVEDVLPQLVKSIEAAIRKQQALISVFFISFLL